MAPDISVMRQEVSDMYSGLKWKQKVAKMPDAQVIAIYFRVKNAESQTSEKEPEDGGQQSLF